MADIENPGAVATANRGSEPDHAERLIGSDNTPLQPRGQDDKSNRRRLIDPRLALLARAATYERLVEAGLVDLADAVGELHHALMLMYPCECAREIFERLDRVAPRKRRRAA